MSGMAAVIADALSMHKTYVRNEDDGGLICGECGWEIASKWQFNKAQTISRKSEHEAFAVLAALTEAGFGGVQEGADDSCCCGTCGL